MLLIMARVLRCTEGSIGLALHIALREEEREKRKGAWGRERKGRERDGRGEDGRKREERNLEFHHHLLLSNLTTG